MPTRAVVQGLYLLHPGMQPQACWQLTAVLALMAGHWPARGLLSGKWPMLAASVPSAPSVDEGLLGSSDNEPTSAPRPSRDSRAAK